MKLESYQIFQNHQASLSELSKDDHDGMNTAYMTDYQCSAVSFDDAETLHQMKSRKKEMEA